MGLGDKISRWLTDKTPLGDLLIYIGVSISRIERVIALLHDYRQRGILEYVYSYIVIMPVTLFAVITHIVEPEFFFPDSLAQAASQDYSKLIATIMHEATTQPALRELLEVMGTLISEPLFSILENYAKQDEPNYQEFLRAFYGYLMLTPVLGGIVNAAGSLISAGQVNNLGKPITDSFWTMGLGFMGWQGISPLLTASVLEGMTRRAQAQFRPKRFTTSQATELFALNGISENELIKALVDEGWRDKDISRVVELSYRRLTNSEIFSLWDDGYLDENMVRDRLRQNGYNETDISLKINSYKSEKHINSKGSGLARARKALKLLIITKEQFAAMLRNDNYSEDAIALELSIIEFETVLENKELSVGQIKRAYNENQINQSEAKQALIELDYSTTNADILIKTWIAAKAPRILKINQSNITRAIAQGVLSADEGLNKLVEIGYQQNDANLIIQTITVKGGGGRKVPTDAQLLGAMQAEIISSEDVIKRLEIRGYTNADANLLVSLTKTRNIIKPDIKTISDAFRLSVFNEATAIEKLQQAGASPDFISTRISVIKAQKKRTIKQANPATIAKWFRHGLISNDKALEMLQDNMYSLETAQLFMQAIGLSEPKALSQRSIELALENEIISDNEALGLLAKIGLNPDDSQVVIKTVQVKNNRKAPKASISALLDATRKELISLEMLERKLSGLGLQVEDVKIYMALATFDPPSENIKLSKGDILKGYRNKFLDRFTSITMLESKGYSLEESELLIRMERLDITDSFAIDLFQSNKIDRNTAKFLLSNEGFTNTEINNFLEQV